MEDNEVEKKLAELKGHWPSEATPVPPGQRSQVRMGSQSSEAN